LFEGQATITVDKPRQQSSKKKRMQNPARQQPTPEVDETDAKERGLDQLLDKWGDRKCKFFIVLIRGGPLCQTGNPLGSAWHYAKATLLNYSW
jgi:hypothetical protein